MKLDLATGILEGTAAEIKEFLNDSQKHFYSQRQKKASDKTSSLSLTPSSASPIKRKRGRPRKFKTNIVYEERK
jgi:hypothetical protein